MGITFQAVLYGTDKQITLGRQILTSEIEALGDIVKVEFTPTGRTDLLQVMENRSFEIESEEFWSGGKHTDTSKYNRTWTLISKPIPLFNNANNIASEYLFLDALWDKKYKFLNIMDYKIRPTEIFATESWSLRVNITSIETVREAGNIQYKINCEGIK